MLDKYKKGNSTYMPQDDTLMIIGKITHMDLEILRHWTKHLSEKQVAGTLLIDSIGGISSSEALIDLIKVPVHTHILRKAQSFAALMALCGSFKTAEEDANIMVHAARIPGLHEESEALHKHNFDIMSIIGSILPSGDAKDQIGHAISSSERAFLDPIRLYEACVLDKVGKFKPNLKNKEVKEWIERVYHG